MVAGSPTAGSPTISPHIGSLVDIDLVSSCTTPSCTPLPFDLHIDEEDCSAPTFSADSNVVITSSNRLQSTQIQQKDAGGRVTSAISRMESLSISRSLKQSSETQVNNSINASVTEVSSSKALSPLGKSLSPVTAGRSLSPLVISKSLNPVTMSKSPSPPDNKCSSLSQSHNSPRPVPQCSSPVTLPTTTETLPKSASPVTVPRLSSPVSFSKSPVTVSNISSPEKVPKCASPVSIPRLSSPVPKIASPVIAPNYSVAKSLNQEKNAYAVKLPKVSSPVTSPKREAVAPKSPATVIKKTYNIAGTSSARSSPVSPAARPSNSLSSPLAEKQEGKVLDLTWPCREPLLDNALDKLLAPDPTQPDENQPAASVMPGEEDRPWDDEDAMYLDLSREGTLTPMTESSWIDECQTPPTCPGTPDATLDLPTQQPSAVERLSASGQVGGTTRLDSQNKLASCRRVFRTPWGFSIIWPCGIRFELFLTIMEEQLCQIVQAEHTSSSWKKKAYFGRTAPTNVHGDVQTYQVS